MQNIRFPPTVNLVLCFSYLSGLIPHTILSYVTCLLLGTEDWGIKIIGLVPGMLFLIPYARPTISLHNDSLQVVVSWPLTLPLDTFLYVHIFPMVWSTILFNCLVCEVLSGREMEVRSRYYVGAKSCCFGVGIVKCCCVVWWLIYTTIGDELSTLRSVICTEFNVQSLRYLCLF